MERVGSILHGAYGDYYEQMLCLKHHARTHPGSRVVLFFRSEARLRELQVFDLSWAHEIHLAADLNCVPVDRFLQFQIKEPELQEEVLAHLEPRVLRRLDPRRNRKPWTALRGLDFRDPETHIDLSPEGRVRLPECMRQNRVSPELFQGRFTVGFLWRYRRAGGAVSPSGVPLETETRRTKSELLNELIRRYDARVLVCGMNVRVTEENRERVDAKFTEATLDLDPERVIYLKGLSWGLELEILRRCTLCLVMPSGFSEALWIKRTSGTVLVDTPRQYLLKLLWNRMPLFGIRSPQELLFQLRQPHTAQRVLAHLARRDLLPRGAATVRAAGRAPVGAE